jgi:multidrug efflux system outer membrane protein
MRIAPSRRGALALSALLGGCAIGPDYQRPAVPTLEGYRGDTEEPSAASLADLPWWEVFQDEQLRRLVSEALASNYDVRIALPRIEEARQGVGVAESDFFPHVDYTGFWSRGKNNFGAFLFPFGGTLAYSVQTALIQTWELDIWVRIRRSSEAARAELLSTEDTRRAIWLSLVSDVAQAYFELLELDLELDIARKTTDTFRESLRLFELSLRGGTGSKLETAFAAGALATVEAAIPDLEIRIAQKENQINLLLGRPPGPVPRTATLLGQRMPPAVPPGLPSQLLERRPDVMAAEQNVVAANARVGVALANFFPKIGLTTVAGMVSRGNLNDMGTSATGAWAIVPNISGPIFEGGRLRAEYARSDARLEELVLRYQWAVTSAFHDVSNALIARAKLDAERAHLLDAVHALEEAVTASLERYKAGRSAYLDVLQAQQQLFPAQTALARVELARLIVVVQLYKALGGGWKLTDDGWTTKPPG